MGIRPNDDHATRAGAGGDVKAVAVVKLFIASPDPNEWSDSGIVGGLAAVSAGGKNYLRIVDFNSSTIVFEQEFYTGMEFSAEAPFFYTLELSEFVGGFCFADVTEANGMAAAVAQLQGGGSHHQASNHSPVSSHSVTVTSSPTPAPSTNLSSSSSAHSTAPSPRSAPATSTLSSGGKKKEGSGFFKFASLKKKLGMKDSGPDPSNFTISAPSGFRHDAHIGWDPENGFEIRNIPPAWRKLFQEAGVKKKDLQNKETAAFIMETVMSAMGDGSGGPPPPAPPAGGGGGGGGGGPPPPPPPPGGGPPPPPPPPPPPGAPPSIAAPATNSRGGLLAQIQQGKELRSVEPGGGLPDLDNLGEDSRNNLTNTLANALALRRADMIASDGDEEDEGWDEWDENV